MLRSPSPMSSHSSRDSEIPASALRRFAHPARCRAQVHPFFQNQFQRSRGLPCGFEFLAQMKKPAGRVAGGLGCCLISVALLRSGHSSPPAWSVHDGGDGRDEGGSASDTNPKGKPLEVSNHTFVTSPAHARLNRELSPPVLP